MEKEAKKPEAKPAPAPAAKDAAISFDNWFTFQVSKKSRVSAHHYSAIKAYFKHKGLGDESTVSAYDSMLKVFGF
jgi:hypothetical protein